MRVFYPTNTSLILEARLYANESAGYTKDFDNWEDKHRKKQRLVTGNFIQYWVYEFCRLNGVPYERDNTTPYENDDFDIKVCGKVIDIKASVNECLVGQVTRPSLNKPVDYFGFFLTDIRCTFAAPFGFISKDAYRKNCVEVKHGETIPGTRMTNRFDVTYFLDPGYKLVPFVSFLIKDIRQSHVKP